MKSLHILTMVLALLLGKPALAGWSVGNGGDGLRLAFVKAREHAAFVATRISSRALAPHTAPRVRAWLEAHQHELATDILASKQEWTMEPQATCAWTTRAKGATVELSFPTCRESLGNFEEAAALLVHESVHHFGIDDEAFADAVAIAIYDTWRSGQTDWLTTGAGADVPPARWGHSMVWTGKEVLVFGGVAGHEGMQPIASNSGYLYDPTTDSWRAIATHGAPARYMHQAIWTGKQLVVWGGYATHGSSKVWQNSGAIWDAASDRWMSLDGAAGPLQLADLSVDPFPIQTMVSTGDALIIFGGAAVGGQIPGGIYDLKTRTWRPISMVGAPQRRGHSAVWADDRMIVFGGRDVKGNLSSDGAVYDPLRDQWTPLAALDALAGRAGHSAVWTGSKMIVFGGLEPGIDTNGVGAIYEPARNLWTTFDTEAVQGRVNHTALWTGSEMLIYGGKSKRMKTLYKSVSAFNPTTMQWRVVEAASAPAARLHHAAVWTGAHMVVWGGQTSDAFASSGGIFYP